MQLDRTARRVGRTTLALLAGGAVLAWSGIASASGSTSPTFAGYVLGGIAPTKAATSFKLPSFSCTSTNSGIAFTIGLTNFTTEEFTTGQVVVGCSGGSATYGAEEEINDSWSYLTPTMSAGDAISITVSVSATKTTVSVKDKTKKSSVTDTVKGPGGGGTFTGAGVGDSALGSSGYPIPTFGTLKYSATTINSLALGTYAGAAQYNMSGPSGNVKTSTLKAGSASFTTKSA
ncbi:MAG TPA: hypothetical protein VKA05_04530 [Acidimicrobiales bacterium]|nr:hypothetical protein [Acidimicrobiales bacterium]